MLSGSILYSARFNHLPLNDRAIISACERTTHESILDALAGCREHLPEEKALSAAIVGTMSALCRLIAEAADPLSMKAAIGMMMECETLYWCDVKKHKGAA